MKDEDFDYRVYFTKKNIETIYNEKDVTLSVGAFALIGLVAYGKISDQRLSFSLDAFKSWNDFGAYLNQIGPVNTLLAITLGISLVRYFQLQAKLNRNVKELNECRKVLNKKDI